MKNDPIGFQQWVEKYFYEVSSSYKFPNIKLYETWHMDNRNYLTVGAFDIHRLSFYYHLINGGHPNLIPDAMLQRKKDFYAPTWQNKSRYKSTDELAHVGLS